MSVINGLMALHREFRRANLKPPTVVLLESHEEGMRFISSLGEQLPPPVSGQPTVIEMADGSAWMSCVVAGRITVRWPANRRATPDGSWSYE